MENENNENKRKVSRQSWKPEGFGGFLLWLWTGVWSVLKIALAALATVLVIAAVCVVVFVGVLADYLEGEIAPQAGIQLEGFDLDEPSYLYYVDDNGNIQELQRLYADTKNEWVSFEDIPEDLIHAAVSIEDHRFFEHQGVDWFTTIKACVNMFVGSGDQFGGSSITQQLIKNLLLMEDESADDVTVQRKVLEIFRATEFEKKYDKTVVLEWYMNVIYLGNNCKGVKAAAAKYYGKELEHLTTAECAALIGITNNPSKFNPYRDALDKEGMTGMEQLAVRKENTLWLMRNYGYITEEEYQEALAQELVLKDGIDPEDKVADCPNEDCAYHGKVGTFLLEDGVYYCPQCGAETDITSSASQEVYSWFVDVVLEDVAMMMAEEDGIAWNDEEVRETYMNLISRGGYHIYTTMDMKVQEAVDAVYKDLSQIPTTNSIQQLQSGIVIIDNETGDIVALAGGVGDSKGFDDYNCATEAKLQPGSALKPLTIYSPAFELGLISPASVMADMPIYYTENEKNPNNPTPYPKNFELTYGYSRTVLEGVQKSVNAVAVNTLKTMGFEYSFNFAKDRFGLEYLTESYVNSNGTVLSDLGYSPLGMGAPTIGVTVRQMSTAYATFANNGVYREARTFTHIYNSDGELVMYNDQETHQVLSEKALNYMNYCLDQAVQSGTGRVADIAGQNVAGKTGTTSAKRDQWFCGFTGYYTAAVWTGYLKPEVISLTGDGTNPAARLFKKVMTPIHEGLKAVELYDDSQFVPVNVCLDSGKKATTACGLDIRGSRVTEGFCYEEDASVETCDKHVLVDYCSDGCANEYCRLFASVGQTSLTKKSLVKLTQEECDNLVSAGKNGLYAMFLRDDYIYLVDENGNDAEFHGLKGTVNAGIKAPYEVCTEHTAESWAAYLAAHPDTQDPTEAE